MQTSVLKMINAVGVVWKIDALEGTARDAFHMTAIHGIMASRLRTLARGISLAQNVPRTACVDGVGPTKFAKRRRQISPFHAKVRGTRGHFSLTGMFVAHQSVQVPIAQLRLRHRLHLVTRRRGS